MKIISVKPPVTQWLIETNPSLPEGTDGWKFRFEYVYGDERVLIQDSELDHCYIPESSEVVKINITVYSSYGEHSETVLIRPR